MLSQRVALRAARTARVNAPAVRRNVRFASDGPSATPNSPQGSGALYGGLAGGGAAFVITYLWYQFSGAATAVSSAKQAKGYYDSAKEKLKVNFKEVTPEPNEAIQVLRDTANKYAKFVPGGQQYVDKAFQDLEAIQKKHGSEVDDVVRDAYGQLRDVSKKGVNLETANEAWNILSQSLQRLGSLSGEAAQDILNNHPQLKQRFGGSFDQLKQLGDRLGPDAQKMVNETYGEISKVLQGGLSWDTFERVRKLVQDKTQELQKMGEKAFDQGFEQVKPVLDKNPKVKELVNKNLDSLKQGDVTQLVNKVRDAVSSGNTGDLEQYVKQASNQAQQFSSGSLSNWLDMVPGGSEVLPQLQKLKSVAEQQGSEAEQLAKDTMKEIKQVLEKRGQKLEQLWQEGQKQAKN